MNRDDNRCELIAGLHENALVAWDRDIPGDIAITPTTQVIAWRLNPEWSEGSMGEDSLRHDGIGVVHTFSLFRAVLFLAPEDPLGVRWWLQKF